MKEFSPIEAVTLTALLDPRTAWEWFREQFRSASPITWNGKFRETYPDTQRQEITFWDFCLGAGLLLFIALGFFLLQSVTCFHNSEACFLGSARLGKFILELIQ